MYKILMSHDPTHWHREVLPESDVQLMLSGHTHEMQFSLFGFSLSQNSYIPEHNGFYTRKGKPILVCQYRFRLSDVSYAPWSMAGNYCNHVT